MSEEGEGAIRVEDLRLQFQVGEIGDCIEYYESIMKKIHTDLVNGSDEGPCVDIECIAHVRCGQQIVVQVTCQCKATSEPETYQQIVQYVPVASMISDKNADKCNFWKESKNGKEKRRKKTLSR